MKTYRKAMIEILDLEEDIVRTSVGGGDPMDQDPANANDDIISDSDLGKN